MKFSKRIPCLGGERGEACNAFLRYLASIFAGLVTRYKVDCFANPKDESGL